MTRVPPADGKAADVLHTEALSGLGWLSRIVAVKGTAQPPLSAVSPPGQATSTVPMLPAGTASWASTVWNPDSPGVPCGPAGPCDPAAPCGPGGPCTPALLQLSALSVAVHLSPAFRMRSWPVPLAMQPLIVAA